MFLNFCALLNVPPGVWANFSLPPCHSPANGTIKSNIAYTYIEPTLKYDSKQV